MGHVIDASVALKWTIPEEGSQDALIVKNAGGLVAPDLLVPECANAFWKKVRRREFTTELAILAARVIEEAPVELVPTRSLAAAATELAVTLDHPAYDCFYLALARERELRLVTADDRLLRTLAAAQSKALRTIARSLANVAAELSRGDQ
jgi:predicted nucleic acid-binding protein